MSNTLDLLKEKLKTKEIIPRELSLDDVYLFTKKREYDLKGSLILKTSHVSFDKSTKNIHIGKHSSKTITSTLVRPFNDNINKKGIRIPFGANLMYDLSPFSKMSGFNLLKQRFDSLDRDTSYFVYALFHYNNYDPVYHGFIITDDNYQFIDRIVTGKSFKSRYILSEVAKYISFDINSL